MADYPTNQAEETNQPSDPDPLDSSDEEFTLIEEVTEEVEYELIEEEQEEFLRQEAARTQEEQRAFLNQEEQEEQETVSDTPADTLTNQVAPLVMSRWLNTARTDQEAQGMAVAVKKEDRGNLSADALIKLQKTVTEGMTLKFSLMSHHSNDQLD